MSNVSSVPEFIGVGFMDEGHMPKPAPAAWAQSVCGEYR